MARETTEELIEDVIPALLVKAVDEHVDQHVNEVLGALLYETIRLERPDIQEWLEDRLRYLGHAEVVGGGDEDPR